MNRVELIKSDTLGSIFTDCDNCRVEGQYYFRNKQVKKNNWRHVSDVEKATLLEMDNIIEDFDTFLVYNLFDPTLIRRSNFHGLVRIGNISGEYLRFHDLELPQGIVNSTIISCDIGNNCAIHNCAIHNCAYVSHYIIKDRVLLHNTDKKHSVYKQIVTKYGLDQLSYTLLEC